jgi:hypothetical protein
VIEMQVVPFHRIAPIALLLAASPGVSSAADAQNAAPAPAVTLVVPGVSLGQVKLGMTDKQIYALLGEPQQSDPGPDSIEYRYPTLDLTINNATNTVVNVTTADPRYSTAEGVGVGSSVLKLSTKLGLSPADCVSVCSYAYKTGITFQVPTSGAPTAGKVASLWIWSAQ